MDVLNLINQARHAGLRTEVEGERLHVAGPKSARNLVIQLSERKTEVIAALRAISDDTEWQRKQNPQNPAENISSASSTCQFSTSTVPDPFTLPGYSPGCRIIRNGIEHKRSDCTCWQSWRHVSGAGGTAANVGHAPTPLRWFRKGIVRVLAIQGTREG